jgi:hypothetical protein
VPGRSEVLCDGGPCPVGGAPAGQHDQCLSSSPSGQLQSFIYARPQTAADCGSAWIDWRTLPPRPANSSARVAALRIIFRQCASRLLDCASPLVPSV